MSRKPRIHYEDAVYHVIARGNNKERIFEKDENKVKYLELLADYKDRYSFRLFAYVIMDNHVHLLIQVGNIPLAKIMQGIQQRYTQYYNLRHKHSGHVFEQRYKSFLCETESYLMSLVCYIHQNPVRANMPEGMDYKWSSHKAYVKRRPGLVDIDFILNTMSPDPDRATHQYLDLVGAMINKPAYKSENEHTKASKKTNIKEDLENGQKGLSWDGLVDKIIAEEAVDRELLLGKCRVRQVVATRKRLIYEALKGDIMTRMELANVLQLDPANITRTWQELEEK